MHCDSEERVWENYDCDEGYTCRLDEHQAFCADEDPSDPRCAPDASGARPASFCEGNVIVSCSVEGLSRYEHNCAAFWETDVDSGDVCVASQGHAFCAESSEPDPLCAGREGNACDGGVMMGCFEGYRTTAPPCDSCVDEDGVVFCAASPETALQEGKGTAGTLSSEGLAR
jgi:hypothetical protein